jgi:hypothetical protein
VKTRQPVPGSARSEPHDKSAPAGRPTMSPGHTEATRPRDKRDEVQKGPGSAGADVQMTADGGGGAGKQRGKSSR